MLTKIITAVCIECSGGCSGMFMLLLYHRPKGQSQFGWAVNVTEQSVPVSMGDERD
jgi:hypothetical protein